MNKRICLFLAVIITVLVLYTNEYLKIEYNITVWDYIKLYSDLTDEEKALLEKSDVLIYGGNINDPPLGIYYEANKQYIGLVVDYINALSIELGTTIVSRPMVWNDAMTALSEERTDICDMIPSDERAKDFAFSDPLYDLKGVVLLPVGKNDIEFLVDLKGKRVSVQKGDYTIECLDQKGIEPIYHKTDDLAEALQLLYDGEVDAVIGDEPVIWYHLNELTNREDYQILDKPLFSKACVLAVSHSKDALIPILNKAIFNLRRKGILNQIHTKWLGPRSNIYDNNEEEKLRLNLYVLGLVIIIGGTLIYLWNRSLKVLVAARTSELLLTKDELQIAFDGMANYLVVIGHDRLIYNVNEAFTKYLGYTKSNIKGMEYGDISILNSIDGYFKETIMQDEAIVNSMLSNDKLLKFDYKYDARHYVVEIYPLKERESSAERLLLILSDVTETKHQDLKMSHSNKMAAIGQLAAGVAHELRNPLGVIRNSTFILDNADSEEDEEHKLIAMKSINNAVKRASGIIDNLLTFSRLTNNRVEVCNLNDLILEVTRYYRKAFRDYKIKLLVTCNSDILFETNQESVKHILINLIQNAIDAMGQGGRLTIECEEMTDRVSIKVSDDGTGLSEEVKNRIFEPFFTTKPVGKGTGLGLYITYSEVQKINGEIRVSDNTNCGTTFIIEIPKVAS